MVKKTILVAEDDRPLLELLGIVLSEEGFEVVMCPDGRSAVNVLTRLRDENRIPTMILLDLNMPFITGWEVAAWLDADPKLTDVPLIVISATESHGRAAKSLHADAYLVKPFTTDEIVGVVGLFAMMSRPGPRH